MLRKKTNLALQLCVKRKAVESIVAVRTVTQEQAMVVVDKVFDRCYNDLEPFGRRIRSQSDAKLALAESHLYGYKVHGPEEKEKKS